MKVPTQDNESESAPGIIAKVPDGWHTRTQTASIVGRSLSTIKAWEKEGHIKPDGYLPAGSLNIWLYSDRYIVEVVQPLAQTIKRGPKPKGVTSVGAA